MAKSSKNEKPNPPAGVAKGMTMAAMVAALGISLGTEVKCAEVQEKGISREPKTQVKKSSTPTIEIGKAKEFKSRDLQHGGTILKIRGNRVTVKEGDQVKTYSVKVKSGDAAGFLKSNYRVGDAISGELVEGQLLLSK